MRRKVSRREVSSLKITLGETEREKEDLCVCLCVGSRENPLRSWSHGEVTLPRVHGDPGPWVGRERGGTYSSRPRLASGTGSWSPTRTGTLGDWWTSVSLTDDTRTDSDTVVSWSLGPRDGEAPLVFVRPHIGSVLHRTGPPHLSMVSARIGPPRVKDPHSLPSGILAVISR